MTDKTMKFARFKIALPDIIKTLEDQGQDIFTRSELDKILSSNRLNWRLTETTTTYDFIKYLLSKTKLDIARFDFPSRSMIRYIWGEPSIFRTAISLKPSSYLCHYTAVYLHNLTEQVPKTIYVNSEQSPKPQSPSTLEQGRIDSAFKRKPRITNNIANYNNYDICIISGKNTGRLGVIDYNINNKETVWLTSLERTLIDISVRPFYAGGVFEVLNAYRNAKGVVSVNKLSAMLKKLNYVYPYHQAIGFYLDKAGYKQTSINLMRKFGIHYNFYLTYSMNETEFSDEWRLFYPKGL